ncbi:MAG TPA: S49 family peptidase [Magnetospirillaceae bacterium]|jgi:protease-4
MRFLGRLIVIVLAVIGGFMVLGTVFMTVAAVSSSREKPLPAHMVLSLNLDNGVVETRPDSPLARFANHDVTVLSELVQTLDRAANDPRVNALVVRLDGAPMGMAAAQEVRDAVTAFRRSGKRAVVFSEELGGFGGSTIAAYVSSAFKEVWLQPSGTYGLSGFMLQSPFIKNTLDMLGVQPQFSGRWEYKSAIEMFTHEKFSKEAHETMDGLVAAWTNQAVDGIAASRGLKAEDVRALMDKGILFSDEAKAAGLIDRAGYWDELDKSLTEDGSAMISVNSYATRLGPRPEAVKVALIVGAGPVTSGGGDGGPLGNDNSMAAGRVTQAFRDAVKDPDVKAILFRIDSPGGSYTASDAIWREVNNARAAGKPVVVSMGDVAASGGYFAAMSADRIVAEPGTITGSIGVFAGKFVLADLWKKLGVTWDEVHQGANSGMWSQNQPFTPAGWERLNAMLDHVYADFTDKAEKARKIDAKDMDAVARGRVWPGDKAKEIGLVDENGGYAEAFVAVRRLARLPSQMPLRLAPFPQPRSPFNELVHALRNGGLPMDSEASTMLRTLVKVEAMLQPFEAMLSEQDNTLRMPPIETK